MKTAQCQSSRKASQGRGELVSTSTSGTSVLAVGAGPRHEVIKLSIDVHAKFYMVVRQIDNATPQPGQKFTPEEFMVFAGRDRKSVV